MMRTTIIAACSLAMLAALLAAPFSPVVQAQADPGLRLITELTVPGSRDVKFPHVAASRDAVYVAGNANRDAALVWSKRANATSFGEPTNLGPAEGQPDFSTTSVAAGTDGSIWVAWVNQPARSIYLRQRSPAGAWGPTREVERGAPFPVKPEVGVSGNGTIFVAWRDPDRPIRYRLSTDGGVTWSNRRDVDDIVAYDSPIGLAGGPGNAMAVTFTAGSGGRLQVFVGLWNTDGFTTQRVTGTESDYADSTVSFAPDGKLYAAWRGVAESGGNSGVFYAERQPDGNWPRSRLAGGKITGPATASADEQGNLHFTWIAQPSGGNQIFYAFKPQISVPVGPIASGDRGTLFNARAAGGVSDSVYNHAVSEEFTGAGLRTRYSLFQAQAVVFGGEPVVERGVSLVRRNVDNSVLLSFRNVQGSPNQVRYSWNRAPTDADPWVAFSNELRVPVPDSLLDNTSCLPATLFTQLRNTTTNLIERQARSTTIQIDGVVEVAVSLASAFTNPGSVAELAGIAGAPGGDPLHTRVPLVYLNVVPQTDCNGLTTMSIGASSTKLETTYQLSPGGFAGVVALPNLANLRPGPVPLVVQVNDGAGNSRLFEYTITLDETRPVLTLSGSQAGTAPDRAGDILQDLTFTNVAVTDSNGLLPGYSDAEGRQFWGLWIANAVDPVANPVSDPSLNWTVVKAPPGVTDQASNRSTFTLQDWSLASGLNETVLREDRSVEGENFATVIYVRFLDGAGNPTDEVLTITVEDSLLQRPRTLLPFISR